MFSKQLDHLHKLISPTYFLLISFIVSLTSATPHGEKSKEMCEQYAKAVYEEEDAVVLLPNAAPQNVSQCGIVEVPLIVGGVKTGPKEFPHMASIGYGEEPVISWLCGGNLISDKYVMTASHCLTSKEKGPATWVRLGDRTLDESDPEARLQVYRVAERIKHPSYNPPCVYNDVALLKIDGVVEFNGFVRPACLHTDAQIPWTKGIATGFGKTDYFDKTGSKELMKVQLSIYPNEMCNKTFAHDIKWGKMPQGMIDSQFCAGEQKGGKDTCQGDSGGPLQQVLEKPYCMYTILGVTSYGKFCGFRNSPAVYTRVSYFVPWIESIVWQQ